MKENYDGVKFYRINDLSCGYELEKAEKILQIFCTETDFSDVNKIIELYNIKKYFENNLRLKRWTDDVFENYKEKTKAFDKIIGTFFYNVKDNNLIEILTEIDKKYIGDFWALFSQLKRYENISAHTFSKAIEQLDLSLVPILKQNKIVSHYGQEITERLRKSRKTAELLMSKFLEVKTESFQDLCFPKQLTDEHKEEIILEYIRSEDPNPNYLILIAESQHTTELPLQDKTRLEARKKHEEYIKSHFAENNGIKYGVKVNFSKTQIGLPYNSSHSS